MIVTTSPKRKGILSDDSDEIFLYEMLSGTQTYHTWLEGENIVALNTAIDRAIENFNLWVQYKLVARQVERNDVLSINGSELNDKLKFLGIPVLIGDTTIGKKNRLKNWWKNNYGGGSEPDMKSNLYFYIGSSTFTPFESSLENVEDTTRIVISRGGSQYLWSDDASPVVGEFNWTVDGLTDEQVLDAGGGFWSDENQLSNADFNIIIYFGYSGVFSDRRDITYWQSDDKMLRIQKLVDKIKPLGSTNTITLIYDGA